MEVIYARNVNDALRQGVERLERVGVRQDSRGGEVLVSPTPVMTVTQRPTERVLLDGRRDANPFFHLFESLWMLSGMNDATWLDRFVSDFSSRYAEEDGTMWGAYGHRWRRNWDDDQLDVVVERLRRDPLDRRVVITMWDPSYDLTDPRPEMERLTIGAEPRDVPCNTHIYPRIREVVENLPATSRAIGVDGELVDTTTVGGERHARKVLDITICCRSNDVIWGAHGANAVHFSVLQEYLAGRLGVGIGRMYQLSNNYHGYTDVYQRKRPEATDTRYMTGDVAPTPMGTHWDAWDADLRVFMGWTEDICHRRFLNEWFHTVAQPMWLCHAAWRDGDATLAMDITEDISASDWRTAAQEWMQRRTRT